MFLSLVLNTSKRVGCFCPKARPIVLENEIVIYGSKIRSQTARAPL